jgi:hypothetical protein
MTKRLIGQELEEPRGKETGKGGKKSTEWMKGAVTFSFNT